MVVLAGDIHTKTQGVRWALDNIPDKHVVYVFGNHEFYKKTYPSLFNEARILTKGSNIHILENEVFSFAGVNFLGCTLWTDFKLFGDPKVAGYHCQQIMTDYRKIKRLPNYSKMRSINTALIHNKSREWLANELKERVGQKNIVVTHHAPSIQSVAAEYKEDLTSAAYASDLENFICEHNPAAWLHGHMHNSCDYMIGKSRILCNAKGYSGEENLNFRPSIIYEI